ncbi:hypothetical protein [Vibrio aestuarianus]|uniref:hypothetical protein n=1 Tax=Vibrio aestuarianus TaxID=28171 RepID=UPI00237CDEB4|nr:hypothetical protein [Vibrio aestuarianus]MDE1338296.1 hypothetical protein [Vibrio aestuarianus]
MINHTLLETHFLNSSNLLNYLEDLPLREKPSEEQIKHHVFLSYHEANRFQPDHLLHCQWEGLKVSAKQRCANIGPIIAIEKIVQEHFVHEKAGTKVELSKFSNWQNIMSRVSCLSLHAWFSSVNRGSCSKYCWPLYPYHPYVEDYLTSNGLHETHQHLNGSTSAEECWLDALRKPTLACQKFSVEYGVSADLRQLCAQIDPELTPTKLINRLTLARVIREILAIVALGHEVPAEVKEAKTMWDLLALKTPLFIWPTSNPYGQHAEHKMLVDFFSSCERGVSPSYERLLWVYLLIQNQYLSLLVQRDDFYGFDQFQKYTFTELRDLTERSYMSRFKQVHGTALISQVESFEGRFAPKKNSMQMEELLTKILAGYLSYLKPQDRPCYTLGPVLEKLSELNLNQSRGSAKLALVAHFIKRPPKNGERYPYEALYNQLNRQTSIIIGLIKKEPRLKNWLRGVDAAANEMHTPPEVFAPIFRVLNRYGIEHITYHVGEDFPHLISGIRSISEALEFLPLRSGDRLGHCTAIGIEPEVWCRTLPMTIYIKRETLLLDNLFIWRELRNSSEQAQVASTAASKAIRLASTIFDFDHDVTIETLDELMSLRCVLPMCRELLGDKNSLPPYYMKEEFIYSEKVITQSTRRYAVELYKKWLTDQTILKRRQELESVNTAYASRETTIALQQSIMKKIASKSVAVECPPTSNTRISQYNDISEHHIFRWMGLEGARIEGDTLMSICLGSDDPGIFVTDLKAEFYHLFSVLVSKFGVSPEKAVSIVGKVNENGKVFRFHQR